jgi:hypothetical protein
MWLDAHLPVVLQALGVVVVSIGFGLVNVEAGVIAGGAGLLALGVAAEMGTTELADEPEEVPYD